MENNKLQYAPLADRMRPNKLEDFFGQIDLVGKNSFLYEAIRNDQVPSLIFWGPPGSGKTTLAFIIANLTKSEFIELSAVSSGKKDLLKVLERAEINKKLGKKTVLFIDEIHRWNKAQQDALLPHVEKGKIILIGATTENPSFEVISALLSRARVFVLKKLETQDIEKILNRAVSLLGNSTLKEGKIYPHTNSNGLAVELKNSYEKTRILSNKLNKKIGVGVNIDKETIKFIARFSNGDARTALNTLESASDQGKKITIELVKKILQKSHLFYDKTGEEHYNIISALHKSMRGGDANAAVYWLARMLEGGEDPIYVARRLVRFASEDIGLANNTALILANAVFDACHKIGMPECSVHLAQCVIYLAKSKKDITAYLAYESAKKDVEEFGNLPVPLHIRNAPTKLMKELNYGKGYKYTPIEDSSEQEYLPEELRNRKYIQ